MYDYHVEFCGFDVNTSEIGCEFVKRRRQGFCYIRNSGLLLLIRALLILTF